MGDRRVTCRIGLAAGAGRIGDIEGLGGDNGDGGREGEEERESVWDVRLAGWLSGGVRDIRVWAWD